MYTAAMTTHIVSGHAASGSIKRFLDSIPEKSDVIAFGDMLAIGPLRDLDTLPGRLNRAAYWQEVFAGRDQSYLNTFDDADKIERIQELYEDGKQLLFWVGPSANERLGFGRVLAALDPLPDSVDVVWLDHYIIKNKYGESEIEQLGQCSQEILADIYESKRALTHREITAFANEWETVSNIESDVRFHHRRTGVYVHRTKDAFDQVMLDCCSAEFQTAALVIGTTLAKTQLDLDFLQWRLRVLIDTGKLTMHGTPPALKDFEVKRA